MEKINYGLEEMHRIQLDMLNMLIKVCENHGYSYSLAFGSLLGAVREHKIIAWDDSIDVVMPYADYVRITALPQEVWGQELFMQTYYSDPQYPRYYAKLRKNNTTLIKADYVSYDINQGIYINIMPLIKLSDHTEERKRQLKDAKLYKALTEGDPALSVMESLRLFPSFLLGSTRNKKEALREELKDRVIKYEEQETKDCFVLAGENSLNLALSRDWFSSSVDWEFEGMQVKIAAGWNEWLTLRYGDYMTVPISELQGDKISGFVTLNTQRSYTEYKGKTYCV